MTIRDMLKRPIFQRARLAAGAGGIERRVGWVHVLEITRVQPFVNPNDLILSTGLWLKRDTAERLEYMEQLMMQDAAGLCVEFGTSIDQVPQEVMELADQHDFPLIIFEQPVRFVEITQDIHSLLINRQHQLLRDLENFSRRLQQQTQRSSDVTALLRQLHETVSRPVVYISSLETNRYVPAMSSRQSEAIVTLYQQEVENKPAAAGDELLLFGMEDGSSVLFQPVVCFGQIFSAVGMVLHQTPTEAMPLLLDYTAKAAATLVLRTQFLEEKLQRSQNELIQDLLSGSLASEEQAQSRMGLRVLMKGEYRFAGGVLEIEALTGGLVQESREAVHQDILILLRSLLKKNGLHNLVMPKGNQIYILCAKEAVHQQSMGRVTEALYSIVSQLKRYAEEQGKGIRIHAGFGRYRNRMILSGASFEEGYQVIEVTRSVPAMKGQLFYDRLGIYQLLKAVPAKSMLTTFVEDHLGVLINYDREHQLQLVQTLEMYYQCFGSKRETAERLFIHRQTLYNRLDKIGELIGGNLLESETRQCLEMALLAYRMLQMQP
ncbi:PucR family transcriptional regulator [Paenibacillus sp. JX-17]|uniref:PucR family transcriptional regulator n=1 Tax=Paenibacillus lacisoli TaxID=3064525 RepID=A0ABT9CEX6_9BACL|nr:PucR family transcriptional regulator [Paenibacillus sp. JX-17]MDO7907118.1 PucR family transcriptional regulator [Paenibacillus sp. JX-17]